VKIALRSLRRLLSFTSLKNFIVGFIRSFFGLKYIILLITSILTTIKRTAVYRSYWGRGGFYKQALHVTILIITMIVFLSGISSRLLGITTTSLIKAYNPSSGNVDLLAQGSGLQTVLATNPNVNFQISTYVAKQGDTLQSIADQYKVTKDTIKWANLDKYGSYDQYNAETVNAGDQLTIPQISGVLYNVNSGDTLDSIISKTSGDRDTVISVNQLAGPGFSLDGKPKLLIPNGSLAAPAAPAPYIPYVYYTRPAPPPGDCTSGQLPALNGVTFSNPLCHPDCAGYIETRGTDFDPGPYYHEGVDLAKGGGCPVRAACDGTVEFTGWSIYGEGYNVRIDCGNGVRTDYYHSDGEIWVSTGQHVSKGDSIMEMGCSGNCSGTHLHIGLRFNGQFIDPSPYIPY